MSVTAVPVVVVVVLIFVIIVISTVPVVVIVTVIFTVPVVILITIGIRIRRINDRRINDRGIDRRINRGRSCTVHLDFNGIRGLQRPTVRYRQFKNQGFAAAVGNWRSRECRIDRTRCGQGARCAGSLPKRFFPEAARRIPQSGGRRIIKA